MKHRMIVIHRHRYAPELNKFYFVDRYTNKRLCDDIPCPSLTTTKEIRDKFFAPLPRTGLAAKVVVAFPLNTGWSPAIYSGFISPESHSKVHALHLLRKQLDAARSRHNLAGTSVSTSLKVVG